MPKTRQSTCRPSKPAALKRVCVELPRIENEDALQSTKHCLHPSSIPSALPCREAEFKQIRSFIAGNLSTNSAGCKYICGVPGTGKTAVVHQVIASLEADESIPSFVYVEVNGMKLSDPSQTFVEICRALTDEKHSPTNAAVRLAKFFGGNENDDEEAFEGRKRKRTRQKHTKPVVLVVDELDLLWTKKQDILYQLFEWPSEPRARLTVIGIANTMDLPDRMMQRVSSRLGVDRLNFQPYTFQQLMTIIEYRLRDCAAGVGFEEDAVQLVSRKVAAVSGDVRRALNVCLRAAEIVAVRNEQKELAPVSGRAKSSKRARLSNESLIVQVSDISDALKEMFSAPKLLAMRNASLHEKLFLRAMLAEFGRTGCEETTLAAIARHHRDLAMLEGVGEIVFDEIARVCETLAASRLVVVAHTGNALCMRDAKRRLRLNVAPEDVNLAMSEQRR